MDQARHEPVQMLDNERTDEEIDDAYRAWAEQEADEFIRAWDAYSAMIRRRNHRVALVMVTPIRMR